MANHCNYNNSMGFSCLCDLLKFSLKIFTGLLLPEQDKITDLRYLQTF